VEQVATSDTVDADVEGVGQSLAGVAVEVNPAGEAGLELVLEQVPQAAEAGWGVGELVVAQSGSPSERDDERHVLGASAASGLLSATGVERLERGP
jgi:hypothetical protein